MFSCASEKSIFQKKGENVKRVMIISNNIDPRLSNEISSNKVEAAINLALAMTDNYELMPTRIRDSVAFEFQKQKINKNLKDLAEYFNVDYFLITQVNSIENILRTDIKLVDTKDSTKKSIGFGYSQLQYRSKSEFKKVYDPALLAGLQRAFCVALNDTNLYMNAKEGFKLKPLTPLVIGSIFYIDNPKLSEWTIFKDKVLSSYDAILNIFEAAKLCSEHVIFDVDTRDAIYNLDNLYMAENYTAPSENELLALNKIGVDYFITGSLKRVDEGAELNLIMYQLISNQMVPMRFSFGLLTNDSITEYRQLLQKLTKELLFIKE